MCYEAEGWYIYSMVVIMRVISYLRNHRVPKATYLIKKRIIFPAKEKIDALKSSLHPKLHSKELKCFVKFDELLQQTAASLLHMNCSKLTSNGTYTMIGKFGIDGSGAVVIR